TGRSRVRELSNFSIFVCLAIDQSSSVVCRPFHSGRDFRISESEGLSTFTALQRKNIPSKLLYFPRENHWLVLVSANLLVEVSLFLFLLFARRVLNSANSIMWYDN